MTHLLGAEAAGLAFAVRSTGCDSRASTRTIVAVHVGPRAIVQQKSVGDDHRATTVVVDNPSWLNGPPYAVAEMVFDENGMAGCYRTDADLHAAREELPTRKAGA